VINYQIPLSPAISIIHPGLVKISQKERKGVEKKTAEVGVKGKKKTY